MDRDYMIDFMRNEAGLPPRALVFTGDDLDPYDDPYEQTRSVRLAMDRNMSDRAAWHEEQALALAEEDPEEAGKYALEAIRLRRGIFRDEEDEG